MHSTTHRTAFVLFATALSVSHANAAAQPADPAELYHQYCSVCHGDRGDGRSRARQGLVPPPRDFTEPSTIAELGRERMIRSVLEGRPGTAMTGWRSRLTPQEAAGVVDFIRARFMRQGAPAATNASVKQAAAGDAQIPPGDSSAGRAIYAGNCATCHGLEGNGSGPRAYFIFPRPRDFTSAEARRTLDRARLQQAVRNGVQGREMPAWRHVLSESQIADVSEYVFRTFLRPASSVGEARKP